MGSKPELFSKDPVGRYKVTTPSSFSLITYCPSPKYNYKWMWKEGNILFNDTLNRFYLQLYGVRHMVKYHTDSE